MSMEESPPTVLRRIDDWPSEPREMAEEMMERYGAPDEVLDSRLVWHDNGTWKRTELHREGVPHRFPQRHTDYLEQVVDYHVPTERADDVLALDGSLTFERTSGELAAHCDSEATNRLALNLAHDVVTGDRDVEEARRTFARETLKAEAGEPSDYVRRLRFTPASDQGDPGESTLTSVLRKRVQGLFPWRG